MLADRRGDTRLAPLQGVLLRNGIWAATGPNFIYPVNGVLPLPAITAVAQVLEQGPLQASQKVGRTAVFLPDAPVPHSGTLPVVENGRIQALGIAVPAALKWFKSLGIGSRELLGRTPSA